MLPENQRPQKKWGPYLKYSGLAFQLAAVVLAGILIGGWLQKPLFTMLLVMIFFGGFMYKLYKELTSTK
jgi:NADH:ubiquinone oxidoreductase subunit H